MSYNFTFISHASDKEFIEEKLKPLLKELIQQELSFDNVKLKPAQPVLLFLSLEKIKELLPKLIENKSPIAILPHKDSEVVNTSLGLDSGIKKTIAHLSEIEKPESFNIMYCNNVPVFGHLILGDTFQLLAAKVTGMKKFKAKASHLLDRLFNLRPFALKLHLKNESTIKTVAAGVIATHHQQSSILSWLTPEDSLSNDKMFHFFILSPRSLLELANFSLRSLFSRKHFPRFGGYIKSDQLEISGVDSKPLSFIIDGDSFEDEIINIEMKLNHALLYPGPAYNLLNVEGQTNETYRISNLPKEEAIPELAGKSLPLIKGASTEEFKDLFEVLRENAKAKTSYLVLMILSTVLATFGLFSNSTPVVIGAMILAPLMPPIITLSMATLRQDKKLMGQSTITILIGMGVAFVAAALITWLTPIASQNSEISSRIHPNLLDLGVAVISGIAGAYAHARQEIAKTLAGVAISVALVPPLAVSAIGLGWLDFVVFKGAALLLLTNLAGMILAGALTFLVMGFSPFKLAKRGVSISAVAVLILCIPLGMSFYNMVAEHEIIQQLNKTQIKNVTISEMYVKKTSPLYISLKLVVKNPMNSEELDKIKQEIESKLKRPVILEITTAIIR